MPLDYDCQEYDELSTFFRMAQICVSLSPSQTDFPTLLLPPDTLSPAKLLFTKGQLSLNGCNQHTKGTTRKCVYEDAQKVGTRKKKCDKQVHIIRVLRIPPLVSRQLACD
ncbi:hypothetical protein BaRGS_00018656 [Batillaria attramentaria]|uniref:Uncharacterized protein n=1 Tax=Batillaria attramentaria TaxID=370345 RepID=A0ABD0KT98_9CAEN